jgi:hypothetical protein
MEQDPCRVPVACQDRIAEMLVTRNPSDKVSNIRGLEGAKILMGGGPTLLLFRPLSTTERRPDPQLQFSQVHRSA